MASRTTKADSRKTATAKKDQPRHIGIVQKDPYLEPYEDAIRGRHEHAEWKKNQLTNNGKKTLAAFASGHDYYGLHKMKRGWVFREWAPNATDIYLVGDFNNWTEDERYRARRIEGTGNWELKLSEKAMKHGDLYKMHVYWQGGDGERIPAWAQRVVQDEETKIFSAQVWTPEPYVWKKNKFAPCKSPLLIYECHIGMAQDAEKVGTYTEFRDNVLPRIQKDGYNCIQIMAIQEHPYYGSFGYHVSSFFAPSSRFGTPEELKSLIDTAHGMGIAVIMDIVHSHAVKNETEGLGNLAGDPCQYFYGGDRREHPAWDSLCFDYGKDDVVHFLLSNCKYWMQEFRFDGFRFDGVTSMLYRHHGHTDFVRREQYFDEEVDEAALTYLTLANTLVHDFRPRAVTIAEEVSGMPGIAVPTADGGVGFDYRLGMAIPDFWIRQLKEIPDEQWDIHAIWHVLTDRLPGIKTVAYAESHDQALVGDQTLAFRLMGKEMYEHMDRASQSPVIDRGMALHKMIRLVTISAGGDAYLNFMGNEFGHPEWIDFPREGNGWSYAYARRQWSLADNGLLRYAQLGEFDRAMIALVKKYGILRDGYPYNLQMDTQNQTMAFSHGDLLFVFNWHPSASIPNYEVRVRVPGRYRPILSTDERRFGGTERTDMRGQHFSYPVQGDELPRIRIYNTSRTATVFLREA